MSTLEERETRRQEDGEICESCFGKVLKTLLLIAACVVAALVTMFCLPGCTTIQYGDLRYQRLGGQQFDNFSLTKTDTGDILVEFDKYTGEGIAPIVAAAVKAAVEATK